MIGKTNMKASGVEWIGQIPEGWGTTVFKALFRMSDERVENDPSVDQILSVSGYRGVEPKNTDSFEGQMPSENVNQYRIVRRGQLVVNTMWLNYAGLGVSEYEGYVSPAYRAYDFMDSKMNRRYVHYLLRSNLYVGKYTSMLYGIRPNSLQVKPYDFERLDILVPPTETQQRIVDFLDERTGQIDRVIEKKKRMIELLKEKRTAVITHAVTKGLDPNTKMKASGVEWIGQIPAGWEVVPTYVYLKETNRKNVGLQEKNVLSLSYGNIISKDVGDNMGLIPASYETYQIVESGQIVFRLTDLQNDKRSLRNGIVRERGIITSAYVAIQTINGCLSDYYNYLFRAYDTTKVLYTLGSGVRQSSDYSELKRLPVIVPPTETQQRIVDFLDERTGEIDDIIQLLKKQISKLSELRTSLIYHAVTGKMPV